MAQRYKFGDLRKIARGLEARGCAHGDLKVNVRAVVRREIMADSLMLGSLPVFGIPLALLATAGCKVVDHFIQDVASYDIPDNLYALAAAGSWYAPMIAGLSWRALNSFRRRRLENEGINYAFACANGSLKAGLERFSLDGN